MRYNALAVLRRHRACWQALTVLIGIWPALLQAQVTGSISGYVRDPSGAVVAGSTVTARFPEQQITRSAQTDATGFFNLLALPRGVYDVTAEMAGFSSRTQNNVEVTAGGNVRVDFDLSVGTVGEQVNVQATAPMVETKEATQSSLIDDRRVQDLPLNGRNVIGLANTMANVTNVNASQDMSDNRAGPTMSVNGSNINQNLFTFNGAIFTNFDQTTGFNPPPPDAIQEIRIQTHNFSAEYGYTAGGQVSIVSKAGTNEFHGSAWEFLRNDKLNARSFFQTRRPGQHQNQVGAAGGGPFVKNKLFGFASYQRLWDRREAASSQTIVPTDAQRGGNFTALSSQLRNPTNPLTGAPFADAGGAPCVSGNVISPGCISPAAKLILNKYVPSSPNGVYVNYTPAPRNNSIWMGRMDYTISTSNQLFGHYLHDSTDNSSWPGNLNFIPQRITNDINQVGVSDIHTFSPSFINEATFSYTYSKSEGGATDTLEPKAMGVNLPLDPNGRGVSLSVSGGLNLSYPGLTYNLYKSTQGKDSMTWIRGRHTMKWGYEFIQAHFDFLLALTRQMTFSGSRTGNATADFLLGAFDTSQIEYGTADHNPAGWKHSWFFTDSFKIHPRLTIDYGVRYSPFLPWKQTTGRNMTYINNVQSTLKPDAPKGVLFPGDPQVPEALVFSDLNNFAPRLGLAWDVRGNAKTVVRTGYGIFYQDPSGDITHSVEAPWRGSIILRQGQLDDPFGSLNQPQPPATAPLPGNFGCAQKATFPYYNCAFATPMRIVYTEPYLRTPYIQHVSFSVQQQLAENWAVEASYIGQFGMKLLGHNYWNPARYINSPVTGAAPSLQNVEERTQYLPGIVSAQSRVLGNNFRQWYNAFQTKIQKRLSGGLTFSGDYVFSKNITNQTETTVGLISVVPNPFDLNAGRGPALIDRTHVLVASWVWSPQPKLGNPVLNAIIGDWTLTGLHRFQSGGPLSFIMGTDVAQNGVLNASNQYAMLAPGITAKDIKREHSSTADMLAKYFNTAAFVPVSQVPRGLYGNAGRGLIRGPHFFNSDFAVMRYIPLGTERFRAQLRGEFFNAFNQVNFNNPDTNLSSGNFGRITGSSGGRVIQLALKLVW